MVRQEADSQKTWQTNKELQMVGGYYACSSAKTRDEASVTRVYKLSQRKRVGLLSANAERGKSEVAQYQYEEWQKVGSSTC